jgi:DNA-binding transcriptional LysR family regulator
MRKAAQELYVSEATMSQQIRALETELGFRLFQRENRVLRLSPEGEKLLPDLQIFLQAKGEFEQRVESVRGTAPRALRLALNPYAAMLFLNTIYRKFRSLYPQITLEITEGGTYKLAEQLQAGQLDLALFALSDLLPAEWDDLAFQLLCKTEGVVIASRHHALAHKENISKEHLLHEVKIDYSEEYISRNLYKTVLGNLGEITSIHHPESLLELVQEGTGMMIVPKYVMEMERMEARHRNLRSLDLAPEIHFPLSYVCAYSRQRHIPESLKALLAIIQECYTQISVYC